MPRLWQISGISVAQVLKERNIVRNGVAIRQHPVRIVKIEVDQARHVIPAPQIQAQDMVAQVVEELFHLERERMRLHQRHALDVISAASLWLRPAPRNSRATTALLRRIRTSECRMQSGCFRLRRIDPVNDAARRRTATPTSVRLRKCPPGEGAVRAGRVQTRSASARCRPVRPRFLSK